jgi:hypothetical protein
MSGLLFHEIAADSGWFHIGGQLILHLQGFGNGAFLPVPQEVTRDWTNSAVLAIRIS